MVTIRQALCGLFLVAGATALSGQNVWVTPPAASGSGERQPVASASAATGRKELTYYTQSINQGMFGAPVAAPLPAPKAPAPRKPKPQRVVVTPAPAPDPLADYAFTGVVTMQGRPTALIEHKLTKAGTFIKVGDRFLDGKVTDIDGRQITLALNGSQRSLSRFENYRFIPLDSSAPFLGSGTGAPVPAVPGATPPVPGQAGQPVPPPFPAGNAIPSPPLQQALAEQQAVIQKERMEQQAVPQPSQAPPPPPDLPNGPG